MTDYKINHLDNINRDPLLSEFKHHFILRKVLIPPQQFTQFAQSIHRGFRTNFLREGSIYIVQICNSYDNFYFDLAIGFRHDSDAIAVARDIKRFYAHGRQIDLQLSYAFRIFYEGLNRRLQETLAEEDKRKQGINKHQSINEVLDEKVIRIDRVQSQRSSQKYPSASKFLEQKIEPKQYYIQGFERKLEKKESKDNNFTVSDEKNRIRSRSREKSIQRKYQGEIQNERGWREISFNKKFYVLFLPQEFQKHHIERSLKYCRKISSKNYSLEWRQDEFQSLQISMRDRWSYDQLLEKGLRIQDYNLLLINEEELHLANLRAIVKQYQIKITRINESNVCYESLQELCFALLSYKDFNLRIVNVTMNQSNYIATMQNKVNKIVKFISIEGWKFQPIQVAFKERPSLRDHWYRTFDSLNSKRY